MVISTNPARCRDCYRCVRTCPVKAVRVSRAQAEVVSELCVACATCVSACPQGAKVVEDGIGPVKAALAAGRQVVATVAPSMPAYFDITSFTEMEDLLGALGFRAAAETAFGAEMVGLAHGELLQSVPIRPLIASACPVVVNLVEQYYPDLIPHLAPIVSPMVAHGRYLRQQFGSSTFIVFIGPCIAKKGEAADAMVAGAIDAALTFSELEQWMNECGVGLSGERRTAAREQERQMPARQSHETPARLFPLEGGLVATARMDTNMLSGQVVTGSGFATCQGLLEGIRTGMLQAALVEMMACAGGCINGPALMDRGNVAVSRQRVMAYAAGRRPQPLPPREEWPDLTRTYRDRSIPVPEFSEERIREVLRQVDKHSPEDELNCGSCGYSSCREKAIATLRGMAEATMCIPYMRARAESLNNVVMDATPNAILVVDKDLRIQDMSHSAALLFNCNRASSRGKYVDKILPIESFVAARDGGEAVLNKILRLPAVPERGQPPLILEGSIVPVRGQNLMIAILRDVTEREQQRNELERIRGEAVKRSQEVINRQMRVAHEIASLLGETTAETKVILTQLGRLMEEPGKDAAGK